MAWILRDTKAENPSDPSAAQVAVDARGSATAVWHQKDGRRYNVWSNRCDSGDDGRLNRLFLLWIPFIVTCSVSHPFMRDASPSGAAGPEEATVIFYRTLTSGTPHLFPILVDEKLVGYSERGTYIEIRCEPGMHLFFAPSSELAWPRRAVPVIADLDPGRTYYVEARFSGGGCDVGIPVLKPMLHESARWTKIGGKVSKLQPRELSPEREDPFYRIRWRGERIPRWDGEIPAGAQRLRREDGWKAEDP